MSTQRQTGQVWDSHTPQATEATGPAWGIWHVDELFMIRNNGGGRAQKTGHPLPVGFEDQLLLLAGWSDVLYRRDCELLLVVLFRHCAAQLHLMVCVLGEVG